MEAIEWARLHVEPTGAVELEKDRPWSTVWRIPVGDDVVWLKHCKPAQEFEPRLTTKLYERWSDRVVEVVAHDEERSWLLMRDGGTPIGAFGDKDAAFAAALPLYAELQRGEGVHAADHLAHCVPDLRVEVLPELYEELCASDLPIDADGRDRFHAFAPEFERLCDELPPLPPTVQHDDLHIGNICVRDGRILFLDWGDTSISHPFFSLVVAFWNAEDTQPVRDAYLEGWGDAASSFDLAMRVGNIAHLFKWLRVRDGMKPDDRREFDERWFPTVLHKALDYV
jgi:phosphotransferase family enzyme